MGVEKDELMMVLVPIGAYWAYSGFYTLLESREKHTVVPKEKEDRKKKVVGKGEVVRAVLVLQALQVLFGMGVHVVSKDHVRALKALQRSHLTTISQFLVAMVIFDTWQYFLHRYMHANTFLYKHVHSRHHRLTAPFPVGALYTHPVEFFVVDTLGPTLAFFLSGMTPLAGTVFFCFATVRNIDNHCDHLQLRWNPVQLLFRENIVCHAAHHQLHGLKYNFSSPFFVVWDEVLGTCMPYDVSEREGVKVEGAKVD